MTRKSNESSWFGSMGQRWEGIGRRKADHSVNSTQRSMWSPSASSPLSGLWDWALGSGEAEAVESNNSSEIGFSWNSSSSSAPSSPPSKYESISSSTTSSYPSFWFPGVGDDVTSSVTSRAFLPQDPPYPSSSSNASSPLFLFLDFGGASSGSSASAAASVSPVAYSGAPSHASAAGPAAQSAPSVAAPPHSPSSHSTGANGSASGLAASVASSPAAGILLMLPAPWNETAAENATLPGWDSEEERNLWALLLVLFPLFTLFGNVLVILSVHRERALQTVTNYFIVSLALADLLVAVLVMPFAVYVLVNGEWGLPTFVCDFYIAMDVTCSTSSIFNLVAISIDRYIAVTQPIKYAKHKSQRRVWLTIALVWVISAAIGSPIVLGLNNTANRRPDLCVFYNSDFIIYSSLSSFYIPCIIMVFLYYNIFKALRTRAKRAKAARRPNTSSSAMKPGAVIENLAQTRRLAETALGGAGGAVPLSMPMPLSTGSGGGSGPGSLAHSSALDEDKPTNTGSGSQEEDEEEEDEEEDEEEEERDGGLEHSMPFDEDDDDCDGCHVIPNDKSTEFILATVTAERRRRRQRQQSLAACSAGVVAASAAVGTNGKRLSPSASITGAPIVTATAAAPVVACGIVVATTGVGGDEGVAVGGNHDSGYAASNAVEEEASPVPAAAAAAKEADAEEGVERGREEGVEDKGVGGGRRIKKKRTLISLQRDSGDQKDKSKARKNGAAVTDTKAASSRDVESGKVAKKGVLKGAILPSQGMGAAAASAAGVGLSAAVASKKERKSGSRFTIYKVHKASRKKREKSSAKKERKATKTLAIVLGVFLICWVPFFTCNIMDAICTKLVADCQPGVTAFILTTWLGYMNSFVNPVIYTIFNPEFRKAFKKLMSMGT